MPRPTLPDVLARLESQGQLSLFLNGLTTILDEVFERLTSNGALAGASCSVLSLALRPIDLDFLGVGVQVDDCDDGAVTLDITAIPGGRLLNDLLCSLADL